MPGREVIAEGMEATEDYELRDTEAGCQAHTD